MYVELCIHMMYIQLHENADNAPQRRNKMEAYRQEDGRGTAAVDATTPRNQRTGPVICD